MSSDDMIESRDGGAAGLLSKTVGQQPEKTSTPGSIAEAGATPRRSRTGTLVSIAPDVMTLHTREAYWMFTGRAWTQERRRILGGQRAAAVLNGLRRISVDGNPYADWFLVLFEQELDGLRDALAQCLNEYGQRIEEIRRKGLSLQILVSPAPLQVDVAFASAYGYAIAEAIVEFDQFVRMVKTLVLKNRISAEDGRRELRRVGRPLRRLFVQVLLWERALQEGLWRDVRRSDYLDFSDEAARQRVSAAIERFGPLPDEILSRTVVPRHLSRRTGIAGESAVTLRSSVAPDTTVASVEEGLI